MLTRARMRDTIAKRTGLRAPVVAQVLDTLEDLVREELLQQGEVVFQGLFRVVPGRRLYRAKPWNQGSEVEAGLQGPRMIPRIILTVRPVSSLRKKLSAVLAPR